MSDKKTDKCTQDERTLWIERLVVDGDHCLKIYVGPIRGADDMTGAIIVDYDEMVDTLDEMSNFKRTQGMGLSAKRRK